MKGPHFQDPQAPHANTWTPRESAPTVLLQAPPPTPVLPPSPQRKAGEYPSVKDPGYWERRPQRFPRPFYEKPRVTHPWENYLFLLSFFGFLPLLPFFTWALSVHVKDSIERRDLRMSEKMTVAFTLAVLFCLLQLLILVTFIIFFLAQHMPDVPLTQPTPLR